MVLYRTSLNLLLMLLLSSLGVCERSSQRRAWARRNICPNPNLCMSQWSYCGSGQQYCGAGCRSGPCYGGSNSGSGSGGGSSNTFSGDGTYFDVSVGYTACGTLHPRSAMVAALNAPQFDPYTPNGNPNRNSLCGKRMRVTGPSGSVDVTAVDRCPKCKTGDVDLNEAAFTQISNTAPGRVRISWRWL